MTERWSEEMWVQLRFCPQGTDGQSASSCSLGGMLPVILLGGADSSSAASNKPVSKQNKNDLSLKPLYRVARWVTKTWTLEAMTQCCSASRRSALPPKGFPVQSPSSVREFIVHFPAQSVSSIFIIASVKCRRAWQKAEWRKKLCGLFKTVRVFVDGFTFRARVSQS